MKPFFALLIFAYPLEVAIHLKRILICNVTLHLRICVTDNVKESVYQKQTQTVKDMVHCWSNSKNKAKGYITITQ